MKKNLEIAVIHFFGITALIGLLDLLAARFSFAAFTQIFNRPGHIATVCVLGLILAVGAFFRTRSNKQDA